MYLKTGELNRVTDKKPADKIEVSINIPQDEKV